MRLLQLARKINITPSELIKFIQKEGVQFDEQNKNIKLDDAITAKVLNHFQIISNGPSDEMSYEQEDHDPVEKVPETSESESEMMPIAESGEAQSIETGQGKEDDEEIEVIRAKKIKLQGIKIVGKIDLPERPEKIKQKDVKEETTENGPANHQENGSPSRSTKKNRSGSSNKGRDNGNKQRFEGRPKRIELTYEEKLKRKERAEERRRQKLEKQKKELKRKRYLKSVRQNTVAKPKNMEPNRPDQPTESHKKTDYRNPIRRFWAWLNGEYDDF